MIDIDDEKTSDILNYGKSQAILFLDFVSDGWVLIDSKRLGISKWVNVKENKVYANGSDLHYTTLINDVGKTTEELFDLFYAQKYVL